jgi:PTS system mannose-specific IIC component
MAISLFGVVFGLVMFFIDRHINDVKKSMSLSAANNAGSGSDDDEGDFFND